jgi:hypothetical protein
MLSLKNLPCKFTGIESLSACICSKPEDRERQAWDQISMSCILREPYWMFAILPAATVRPECDPKRSAMTGTQSIELESGALGSETPLMLAEHLQAHV